MSDTAHTPHTCSTAALIAPPCFGVPSVLTGNLQTIEANAFDGVEVLEEMGIFYAHNLGELVAGTTSSNSFLCRVVVRCCDLPPLHHPQAPLRA